MNLKLILVVEKISGPFPIKASGKVTWKCIRVKLRYKLVWVALHFEMESSIEIGCSLVDGWDIEVFV
jgi:hypothetical protein